MNDPMDMSASNELRHERKYESTLVPLCGSNVNRLGDGCFHVYLLAY